MTDRYLFVQKLKNKFKSIVPGREELKFTLRRVEVQEGKEHWMLTCFLRDKGYDDFRYAGAITLPKYWMTLVAVALFGIDRSHNVNIEGMQELHTLEGD